MKIVIPGGTGQIGAVLARALRARGDEVVLVSRGGGNTSAASADSVARVVTWDGRTLGPWAAEIDGADAVINLAGRSVNCRYTAANLQAMMSSRVDTTRVVGEAIAKARKPPPVWLQMSTATIYAHRFDAPNDELGGRIGGDEPDVPDYWSFSIEIAKAWERELEQACTPATRKVALRTAMTMSPDRGGIFDVLLGLTRRGLGGAVAGGAQLVSWLHERDFVRAVDRLLGDSTLYGAINLCAPNPLPHRDFMAALRAAAGVAIGLPAAKWMIEIGAFFMRTDSELLLKSRYVVPRRLLDAGFAFEFPSWPEAARDLVERHALSSG
jgi:uncharacterized protein (TIGR01777 family)